MCGPEGGPLQVGSYLFDYVLESVICKTNQSIIFSAKKFDIPYVIKCIYTDDGHEQRAKTEISILKNIDCEYILTGVDYFDVPGFICVVFPYAFGGDFSQYCGPSLDENLGKYVAYAVLKSLEYLNSRHICHRDIKPENILIMNDDLQCPDIKLIDLGLASFYEDTVPQTDYVGTLYFAAPEILNGVPYDTKVDMWSLGVTLYRILSGTNPFPMSSEAVFRQYASRATFMYSMAYWRGRSSESRQFISSLMQANPAKRPDVATALNNKWILN